MVNVKDYYKTLGVNKDASQDDIKKAFRKLARKYHPDAAPDDPTAADKFKELSEAYEVLSDADKRKKYDQFGAQWEQYERTGGNPSGFDWSQWQNNPQNGTNYQYQTVTSEEFDTLFGSDGFSEFFQNLFGRGQRRTSGGFGFSGNTSPVQEDSEYPLDISLYEAFHGTSRTLTWESGRAIEAKIPAGVKTGSRVRLAKQGYNGGDLYLKITVTPDSRFDRDGDDLRTTQNIDLYTAMLGGKVRVQGIDKSIELTVPPSTQNGRVFRLKGLGMPKLQRAQQRGDLYVTVQVSLPQDLTSDERQLFEQLRTLHQKRQR